MSNLPNQRGVGLIEVLVALLVLSTSLLAIAALQTRSLQYNQSSYFRSQANILAYDIIDRMRINRENVSAYNLDFGDAPDAGGDLASADMGEWVAAIENVLPGGEGSIECNDIGATTLSLCSISLRWTENTIFGEVDDADMDLEARTTFTYTTSL